MNLKILHLSDIHMNYQNYDTDRMRNKFFDYIQTAAAGVDYIVISGDLAFQHGGYSSAEIFCRRLQNDHPNARLIITPGNHDLLRVCSARTTMIAGLHSSKQRIEDINDGIIQKCLNSAFCNFVEFKKKVMPEPEFNIEVLIACELICAAICHQMNWDYLRGAVLAKTRKKQCWVYPEYLSMISTEEVEQLFSDYSKPERIRLDERTDLLRKLGSAIIAYGGVYTKIFFDDFGNTISYDRMSLFFDTCDVFSGDPEEKKKQIFLQNLSEYPEFFELSGYCKPAIDYHIIRSYIRRGLVYPTTKYTSSIIRNWTVRDERTIGKLRGFCAKTITNLSAHSSLTVSQVNNIEWWIGRSVCIRDEPDCLLAKAEAGWLKPAFYRCPFYEDCDAVRDYNLMIINEPHYSGKSY